MAERVGKRGDSWYYRVDLPPSADGRRRQKRVSGFPSERAAKAALAKASVSISEGRLRYSPSQTFEGVAQEWLEVITPNRKATTAANYDLIVRAYLIPRLGNVRLDRLTPARIQQLYGELRASGGREGRPLSGAQVGNIHRVLHNLLGYARRMGYVAANPADDVERPRSDTGERPIYSPEQVRSFLAAVADDRLYALWHLAIATGLRRGELAGLRWSDLELNDPPPRLTVRTARNSVRNRPVESTPKTKAGRRTLVLDRATADALTEHQKAMLEEAVALGAGGLSDYVFVDEMHEPFRPERLTRDLHSIQERAGFPRITLHDLRHTSATIALLAGVHPKVVAERQGHASVQITLDRYSHVIESMQVNAAEAIGRLLDSADVSP